MKRTIRQQAWLERRRYSAHTKKRIVAGGGSNTPISENLQAAASAGNVVPFSGRMTLNAATRDCPEVSVLVMPPRRLKVVV